MAGCVFVGGSGGGLKQICDICNDMGQTVYHSIEKDFKQLSKRSILPKFKEVLKGH